MDFLVFCVANVWCTFAQLFARKSTKKRAFSCPRQPNIHTLTNILSFCYTTGRMGRLVHDACNSTNTNDKTKDMECEKNPKENHSMKGEENRRRALVQS